MAIPVPTANFTRPADTTAYASGDLIANSTTAGSVVPLSWAVTANVHGPVYVRRAAITKTTNVTANASFRVHLYVNSPTVTNGDNGVWLSTLSGYMGSFDVTVGKAFSDPGAFGVGGLATGEGNEIAIPATKDMTIYGLLEARAAYSPGSGEIFTVNLEVYNNKGIL